MLATAIVAAALLAPSPAGAKGGGTFVEIDAQAGVSTPTFERMGVAFSYGGMIGIGGRLRWMLPRFYLMAGAMHQGWSADGVRPETGEGFTASQSLLDLSLGLRVVIPIWKGLRVHIDLMGLASRQEFEVRHDSKRASESWGPGGLVAFGIQYRWHRNASTGLRLEGTFYGPVDSAVMRSAGLDPKHQGKLLVALVQAWYF